MSRNFFSSYSFLESVRFGPAVRFRFLGNSVPVHMESAVKGSKASSLGVGCVRTRGVVTRAGRSVVTGAGTHPESVEF